MTRHYLGLTPRGITTRYNVRSDSDGTPLVYLEDSETKIVILDFKAFLNPSETITAATVKADGVTATISNTQTTVTLTLTARNPHGTSEAEIKTTLSSGEVRIWPVRTRGTERSRAHSPCEDYA